MMNGIMNGGIGLMIVGMVVVAILLVVLIWALIRWLNARVTPPAGRAVPPDGPSALEILKQRYARGEIDHGTYEQMRERLQTSAPSAPPPYSVPH